MLYRSYAAPLRRYLELLVTDAAEAADLTQEVFMRAIRTAGSLTTEGDRVEAWLFRIGRNCALDHRRRRHAEAAEPTAVGRQIEEHAGREHHDLHVWGSSCEIHAAIALLPAAQQRVLSLRYRGALTPAETGHVLGKSTDAVRHLEQRALAFVRERLNEGGRTGGGFGQRGTGRDAALGRAAHARSIGPA